MTAEASFKKKKILAESNVWRSSSPNTFSTQGVTSHQWDPGPCPLKVQHGLRYDISGAGSSALPFWLGRIFFQELLELPLLQHIAVAPYPFIVHLWALLRTPALYLVTVDLYGCKAKGTSLPEETAAVLHIEGNYKFSQEPHLIAYIAFQGSDAHVIVWRHHTTLHPQCWWVCASGKDLKLGPE